MLNLSQILKDSFNISDGVFQEVLRTRDETGGSVCDILVEKKLISETQLLESLSSQYDIPFWPELSVADIDTDFTSRVQIQFLKKYNMVPFGTYSQKEGANNKDEQPEQIQCVIAVNNPSDFQPMDDLARILELEDYQVVLAEKGDILAAINFCYDQSRDSAQQLVQDMEENASTIISEIEETADLLDDTSDAPIVKLVNYIISQSIKARASDIHIEPYQNTFKVRYRVDGILYDLVAPPKHIQSALISRVKVMAKMNIAEKRLPQDGRIEVKKGSQDIDIRVSTIPTAFGERVVLRLLNKSSSLLSLTDLGLDSGKLKILKELIKAPNGIILITGPTGSGKTTTLYAVLSSINTTDINIITIEDPIEYQLNGIGQIQVNSKIDLTFARGLRSILRQDPDVILIGEIRDMETGGIAVQSALTGHLVFSTVHTNDSAGAITRLVDLGIEPFLISTSVIAVIAQRLVRVLCNNCKQPYTPDEIAMESIGITKGDISNGAVFYRAKGCENCFKTGYAGRISIFEIMVLDEKLKTMILRTHDSNQIKDEAIKQNMITLREDGKTKVINGVTSIAEVLRVTQM
jgi:general secretion pathway protein E